MLERAPHVDAVFGTHNVARVAQLLGLARAGGEPVLEVPDAPGDEETDFPTAMAVRHDQPYAAWVTIQVGCDNSCAFCIVPSVRGPEVSRPFGELVEEVGRLASSGTVEVTLLGQNVNSYGRDLTTKWRGNHGTGRIWPGSPVNAGRERVRRGPGPCSPTCSARSGRCPASGASGSRAPTRRTCGPRPSPPWPRRRRSASSSTSRSSRAATACLRAMRRGYTAERYLSLLGARQGCHLGSRCDHRHHRRVPGRDRGRLRRARSRSRRRPSTTAPTPSSSRRGRAPARPR